MCGLMHPEGAGGKGEGGGVTCILMRLDLYNVSVSLSICSSSCVGGAYRPALLAAAVLPVSLAMAKPWSPRFLSAPPSSISSSSSSSPPLDTPLGSSLGHPGGGGSRSNCTSETCSATWLDSSSLDFCTQNSYPLHRKHGSTSP